MARELTIDGHSVKIRHPRGPLGLSIIALGIYGICWYYQINREARDLGEDVEPGIALLAVLVGWIVIVPPFVSVHNTADRIRRIQERAGVASPISPVLALVLLFIPLVNIFQTAYVQSHLNRAYERLDGAVAAPATPTPEPA